MKNNQKIYTKILKQLIRRFNVSGSWCLPWEAISRHGPQAKPIKGSSRHTFTATNHLLLSMTRELKGFKSRTWLPFKHIGDLGGKLKFTKHERGTHSLYSIPKKIKELRAIQHIAQTQTVYNLDETTITHDPFEIENIKDDSLSMAQQVYERFFSILKHENSNGPTAYEPSSDTILISKNFEKNCKTTDEYFSMLFYEIMRATAHKSRLNRKAPITPIYGDLDYSFEGLVCEIGTEFLCAECDIKNQSPYTGHDEHMKSWWRILANNPQMLITATHHAQEATNFVMNQTLEQEGETYQTKNGDKITV